MADKADLNEKTDEALNLVLKAIFSGESVRLALNHIISDAALWGYGNATDDQENRERWA